MKKTARLFCAFLLVLIPACGLLLEQEREVVAEVAGEQIRLGELFTRIRGLAFETRTLANNPDPQVALQTRKDILREMVMDRVMVLEAEDRGIIVSDEELEQALTETSPPQEPDEEHADEQQEGPSRQPHEHDHSEHPEWEVEQARNKLLVQKLMEEELSYTAVQDYYLAHFREEFMQNPPIVSYEILAAAPENRDVVDKLHKLATEEELTLFQAYDAMGQPPQVLEAGVTPPMPLDSVVPQLREKIEKMKKYDISEPFHLAQDESDRYIVIRLERYIKRKPLRLVQGEIRDMLLSRLIEDLEKKFEVKYYYDKLNYRVGE